MKATHKRSVREFCKGLDKGTKYGTNRLYNNWDDESGPNCAFGHALAQNGYPTRGTFMDACQAIYPYPSMSRSNLFIALLGLLPAATLEFTEIYDNTQDLEKALAGADAVEAKANWVAGETL